MEERTVRRSVRIWIIVLASLLAISVVALAGAIVYRYFYHNTAVSRDNVIAPKGATTACPGRTTPLAVQTLAARAIVVDRAEGRETTLQLYKDHAQDSTPFCVDNMFPGDIETKAYALEVSYKGSLTVHFRADIRNGYEKLAEVLKCRITIRDGQQLYDGLMKDMPQSITCTLPQSSGTTETLVYDIAVYLDTSVGNEYMEKELYADFRWWVNEEDNAAPTVPGEPSDPTQPSKPDGSGELIPPKTGDRSDVGLWLGIATVSLLLIAVLISEKLRQKNRKREGANET